LGPLIIYNEVTAASCGELKTCNGKKIGTPRTVNAILLNIKIHKSTEIGKYVWTYHKLATN